MYSLRYFILHDLYINFIVANMIFLIFVILVVLITFKVDLIKLLPLINPSFEHHYVLKYLCF